MAHRRDMGKLPSLPLPDDAGRHSLFGLRSATPSAEAIAVALRHAWTVHHDLSDLGMSEESWARLFSQSEG